MLDWRPYFLSARFTQNTTPSRNWYSVRDTKPVERGIIAFITLQDVPLVRNQRLLLRSTRITKGATQHEMKTSLMDSRHGASTRSLQISAALQQQFRKNKRTGFAASGLLCFRCAKLSSNATEIQQQ